MRRWIFMACLLLCAPVGSPGSTNAQTRAQSLSPAEMADKVSTYVAGHTKTEDSVIIIIGNRAYELSIWTRKDGQRSLVIDCYTTTRSLSLPDPAHVIADQFIWGQRKINIEEHLFDRGIDGRVDIVQTFTKKRGGAFEGFTREERDHGSGIAEFLYADGRVHVKRGLFFWRKPWRTARTPEQAEFDGLYQRHLQRIIKHLNL